jgi:hypothetical protein
VDCFGKQLLARAAFTFQKNRGIAFRDLLQNPKETPHFFVLADNVLKRVAPGEFFAKFLYHTQVSKGFDPADDVILLTPQKRRGNADRDSFPVKIDDVNGLV